MAIDRNKPGSFEISIVSDGKETTVNAEFFWKRKRQGDGLLGAGAGAGN